MLNIPKVFTQMASKALIQSQISAAAMGYDKTGSEHLLIGLCKCADELSYCMLGDLTVREVEEAVLRICGRGEAGFSRIAGMTPHAHRIIVRAITYASPERKILSGTAHLWLELLQENGCKAHMVLEALGLTIAELTTRLHDSTGEIKRNEKAQSISASGEPLVIAVVHAHGEQAGQKQEQNPEEKNALQTYARNLTQEASAGKLEPVIGRERELNAMIRVLGKKTKNNPLLIGEPGVGKSALVEGLAQRIVSGTVPDSLKDARIYALDLAQMVAGAKYRGEFEERVKRVIECAQEEGSAILFIDEMHTLIGTGGAEGSLDAANILKPALARGNLKLIGATTHKEYRKYVEKDSALTRRFQKIDIQEPDRQQTLEILRGLKDRYESFHSVTITDQALLAAVDLSLRYVTDRFMPDKAIDLIDEASSMARLSAVNSNQNRLPGIPCSESGEDISEVKTITSHASVQLVIGQQEIARVVSEWTGVPLEHISTTQQKNLMNLEEQLSKRVIGQEEAVSSLARSVRRAQAGLSDPNRPLGVFMLLGPSGVGKTELCKALSESLLGREDALIRMDMSEYSEEYSISRLIGSPPGYVGHGEGGQLTDAVLKRPYSIVLFDEIEKAHAKLFNLLLQIIDDGHLTDSVGRKVNFKNTIIIMTSNTGVSFDMNKRLGFDQAQQVSFTEKHKNDILAKVRQTFRPEFLGRIDEMIVMKALSEEAGTQIAALMLSRISERIKGRGITLLFEPCVSSWLVQRGIDLMSGARKLRSIIQEYVENPLSELILSDTCSDTMTVTIENDCIVFHDASKRDTTHT